ncbi:hypothetical protein [Paludibacterium denitrificans]|uniref:hypothetical protein n=1 Tax=Paludibacterium denitrificans TaxID=2675226 RepID=UPI001E5C27AA|nr:hypothetical protein [Paludibacterium denitrificans]
MLTLHNLGNTAAVSFEQPLEMLLACHDKIRRFCDQLDKLPGYVAQHGVDEAAKNTIDGAIRYFDVARHITWMRKKNCFPCCWRVSWRTATGTTGGRARLPALLLERHPRRPAGPA